MVKSLISSLVEKISPCLVFHFEFEITTPVSPARIYVYIYAYVYVTYLRYLRVERNLNFGQRGRKLEDHQKDSAGEEKGGGKQSSWRPCNPVRR